MRCIKSTPSTIQGWRRIPGAGGPSVSWGFAAGAGIKLNVPTISQGDYLQVQGNFTEGASRYDFYTPNSNWGKVNGVNEAYGVLSDCVYGGICCRWHRNGLPTHYRVMVSMLRTSISGHRRFYQSLYGSWYEVKYNGSANNQLCALEAIGGAGVATGSTTAATAGCNNNWSTWAIGSRLQWDVHQERSTWVWKCCTGTYRRAPRRMLRATIVGTPWRFGSALTQESSSSNWVITVRAHRDFLLPWIV